MAGSLIRLVERCGLIAQLVRLPEQNIFFKLLQVNICTIDAMHDFAYAQEKWYSTWPKNPEERAMAVYVVLLPIILMF